MRILVADDDQLVRDGIALLLEEEGHSVERVVDGRECLRRIARDKFDLLMVDLVMPEIDGQHVLEFAHTRFPAMDIIVMSAQDDEEVINQMIRLGAQAYLIKPAYPETCIEVVRQVDESRAMRSS